MGTWCGNITGETVNREPLQPTTETGMGISEYRNRIIKHSFKGPAGLTLAGLFHCDGKADRPCSFNGRKSEMVDVFNAKTGNTIVTVPAFMALAICKILDDLKGGFHDYE